MSSVREAQQIIERILAGDADLIAQIRSDQREIAFHFSDEYCREAWTKELQVSGFRRALQQSSRAATFLREAKRTLLRPIAHGRTSVSPYKRGLESAAVTLTASQARETFGGSLYDGIKFSDADFPEFVDYVSGISGAEAWGRWSNADKVVIALKHNLVGEFRLLMRAVGFRTNADVPVSVRIGVQVREVRLPLSIDETRGAWLRFDLKKPANLIEITVPNPTRPEMDGRTIGIGFFELCVASPVTLSALEAKEKFGASLADGVDFALPEFPNFVDSVQGISVSEPWGRWSNGDRVVIELRHVLDGAFRLFVRAVGFGRNAGARVLVQIGDQRRALRLPRKMASDTELSIEFNLRKASNVMEFNVPHPTHPPGDDRTVGIGFYSIRYEQISC